MLVPETEGRIVRSPKDFRSAFDFGIAFVPILGPVEQREPLYAQEAARRALLTSGASRNFRNIWFHYPEGFDEFKELVQSTWPGMDIDRPELSEGRRLLMFCREQRIAREVCWAGYGFQVWCQMLTFIVKSAGASLLVIDEPDIYLHSDLQRQLVNLLRAMGPDVLIATHSAEIISECDPGSLLNVNKRKRVATRIRDGSQIRQIFASLGSNLNPTLAQLAKTQRVVLVEGQVFHVLSPLARSLGIVRVANRSDFAVVHVDGFDARRTCELLDGFEATVGGVVLAAAIVERRCRSETEIREIRETLSSRGVLVHVPDRYGVENYVLAPRAIQRVVEGRTRYAVSPSRSGGGCAPNVLPLLAGIAESMRQEVRARAIAAHTECIAGSIGVDDKSAANDVAREFDRDWAEEGGSLRMVPGDRFLAALNDALAAQSGITVSDAHLAAEMRREEIPDDVIRLLRVIEELVDTEVPVAPSPRNVKGIPHEEQDGALRASLSVQDAQLAAHQAVDAATDWDDVPVVLPRTLPPGRRGSRGS